MANGRDVWFANAAATGRIVEVDEQTHRVLSTTSLPMGLSSNLTLSEGKLWFVGIHSSTDLCSTMGVMQPCTQRFELVEFDPSRDTFLHEIDDPSYGLGTPPRLDGWGTLSVSSGGAKVWIAATDASHVVEVRATDASLVTVMTPDSIWQPTQVFAGPTAFSVVLEGSQGVNPERVDEFSIATGKRIAVIRGS